jgi:hypothetical protein
MIQMFRFPEREPEYVHGEVRDKPLPDIIHGTIQLLLGSLLQLLNTAGLGLINVLPPMSGKIARFRRTYPPSGL